MPPKIPQPIIDLYDAFTHGQLDRRSFLNRLAALVGGSTAAAALLPLLANDANAAPLVSEDDPRLTTSTVTFDTGDIIDLLEPTDAGEAVMPTQHSTNVVAYLAKPAKDSIVPAVIVIHENRGLNAHIRDIARRIAIEGFAAFAIDLLSPYGGTPVDEDAARSMIGRLDPNKTTAKMALVANSLSLLKTHQRKVGAIGFCWGGGMVNRLAAAAPALTAGVCYYGRQGTSEEAARIKASLQFHYAGKDDRINAGIASYEAALDAAGVQYKSYMYEGVQHAFNNDTNAARYDKPAADLAWSRTIAFLKETLA